METDDEYSERINHCIGDTFGVGTNQDDQLIDRTEKEGRGSLTGAASADEQRSDTTVVKTPFGGKKLYSNKND